MVAFTSDVNIKSVGLGVQEKQDKANHLDEPIEAVAGLFESGED